MAPTKLTFRPSEPGDVGALVALYDRHYRGGYSACFDRYGPAAPQDFWWVQSEKSCTLVEANRQAVGMLILGRSGKRLLAEEVIVDSAVEGSSDLLRQVHVWLTRRFQQERQDVLTIRGAETNAVALGVARVYGFTFADALVVAAGGSAAAADSALASGTDRGGGPPGYHLRRARPPDGRHITQLHEEALGLPLRGRDLEALWARPDVRVVLAEREKFPVGFLIAQVRDGAGRWVVGVRQAHRGKGLGRALAGQALQFFHDRRVPSVTTYWGTDAAAVRFVHALGARTERIYLYFERRL